MSTDEIRRKVRAIEKESRRRSSVMMGSGAAIVPSWLAVAWYFPDFRLLAGVVIATALWILYFVQRDRAARRLTDQRTASPSLVFYRELVERELKLHRRLPVWFLPPVVLSAVAIALSAYTSARFAHTPVFFAMMAWLVGGAGVALAIGLKRSRREAERWQGELDALGS